MINDLPLRPPRQSEKGPNHFNKAYFNKAYSNKAYFNKAYKALYSAYGTQNWWPADSPFEVMVGAILTQNTAWENVEKAIVNLKKAKALSPKKILELSDSTLAELLRPSGYFNIKAKRLKNFCQWFQNAGGYKKLQKIPTDSLRKTLLEVNGIGPETADDILLYAFYRPVFVIDAYTRRIFSRLKWIQGDEDYETLRGIFEGNLKADPALFNEYHALIVMHAKRHCRKKPVCDGCIFKKRNYCAGL